jgi:hypothetical protein
MLVTCRSRLRTFRGPKRIAFALNLYATFCFQIRSIPPRGVSDASVREGEWDLAAEVNATRRKPFDANLRANCGVYQWVLDHKRLV